MATNMVALGAAYQAGLLPLTGAAIEAAVRLNGVAGGPEPPGVPVRAALGGRPDRVPGGRPRLPARGGKAAHERLEASASRATGRTLDRCADLDAEARRLLALRVGELIDYQDDRYAAAYVDFVLDVAVREASRAPSGARSRTVIRNLYKLMAYKDEYEVARLHLRNAFHTGTRRLFTAPRRLVWHLHPPLLRALGLRRKLRLGPWFRMRSEPSGPSGGSGEHPSTPPGTLPCAARSDALVPLVPGAVMGAPAEPDVGGHAAAGRAGGAPRGGSEDRSDQAPQHRGGAADAETRRAAGVVSPIQRPDRWTAWPRLP